MKTILHLFFVCILTSIGHLSYSAALAEQARRVTRAKDDFDYAHKELIRAHGNYSRPYPYGPPSKAWLDKTYLDASEEQRKLQLIYQKEDLKMKEMEKEACAKEQADKECGEYIQQRANERPRYVVLKLAPWLKPINFSSSTGASTTTSSAGSSSSNSHTTSAAFSATNSCAGSAASAAAAASSSASSSSSSSSNIMHTSATAVAPSSATVSPASAAACTAAAAAPKKPNPHTKQLRRVAAKK